MVIVNRILLLFVIILVNSCSLIKKREVYRVDSIYIDRTKVVTEKYLDTIITLKSDTIRYTFLQPRRDTSFSITTKEGAKVTITYKSGIYSISSINGLKRVPVKIYEKVVEYRNVKAKVDKKEVKAKPFINLNYLSTLLIVIIVAGIFVYKRTIKNV